MSLLPEHRASSYLSHFDEEWIIVRDPTIQTCVRKLRFPYITVRVWLDIGCAWVSSRFFSCWRILLVRNTFCSVWLIMRFLIVSFFSGIFGSTHHFGSIFGFFVIFGRECVFLMFRGFLVFFGRTLGFLFWHDNHILRNPCNRPCKLATTSHLIVVSPETFENHICFQLHRKFKYQEVVSCA